MLVKRPFSFQLHLVFSLVSPAAAWLALCTDIKVSQELCSFLTFSLAMINLSHPQLGSGKFVLCLISSPPFLSNLGCFSLTQD
ncbi:Uncharacterized protein TCM_032133 [Theobroma cacao]|uniref:Secreted protein n=1 Tax=Theobroma cacao TaxID=3641 RepID=A0A061F910_THECC|nr:Uncharacterized protein TCM_032133 [Theobroma cacao]